MKHQQLDKREIGTVLAALRKWQALTDDECDPGLAAIASEDGEMVPLAHNEVDDLCERLNGPGDMRPFFFDAALNNAKASAQMCVTKLQDALRHAGPVESLLLLQSIEQAADLESALEMILDATRSAA